MWINFENKSWLCFRFFLNFLYNAWKIWMVKLEIQVCWDNEIFWGGWQIEYHTMVVCRLRGYFFVILFHILLYVFLVSRFLRWWYVYVWIIHPLRVYTIDCLVHFMEGGIGEEEFKEYVLLSNYFSIELNLIMGVKFSICMWVLPYRKSYLLLYI